MSVESITSQVEFIKRISRRQEVHINLFVAPKEPTQKFCRNSEFQISPKKKFFSNYIWSWNSNESKAKGQSFINWPVSRSSSGFHFRRWSPDPGCRGRGSSSRPNSSQAWTTMIFFPHSVLIIIACFASSCTVKPIFGKSVSVAPPRGTWLRMSHWLIERGKKLSA